MLRTAIFGFGLAFVASAIPRAAAHTGVGDDPPSAAEAGGDAVITGRVTIKSGEPIRSATVGIDALHVRTVTNDSGRYVLTVPAERASGQVTLSVRSIGYRMETKRITLRRGMRETIDVALARTIVEQRYTNPYQQAIEAVYVFPLPSLAAVNDFVMQVGDRKIVGLVRPRAEAERMYREALARGQTASLLTQERPNIFTQSVANIEPGGEVTIRITYFERLAYDHGEYEYVFPMVVGPRYIPGGPKPDASLASNGITPPRDGGRTPDTSIVPDAGRITPPVLVPGERSGHDIALTVTLDAALPVTRIGSVAHEVEIERLTAARRIVRLASNDSIPNRDFVLRWRVAGAETQFGVLTHRDSTGGYLTLTMQPPASPRDEQVTPREITFIMDVSGSMMGLPIAISKALVTRTLDQLRPDDRFNIVYFTASARKGVGCRSRCSRARPRTPSARSPVSSTRSTPPCSWMSRSTGTASPCRRCIPTPCATSSRARPST